MGYEFDFNSNEWQLDGSVKIGLHRMRPLDDATQTGLRLTLCRYAEELSASGANALFGHFNAYCDSTGEQCLSVNGLANWRATLTDETEHKLGHLKSFILAWYEWNFPGVSKEVVAYLESLTLRGSIRGKAVSGRCPYSGPLTTLEQSALSAWASGAFTQNYLSLEEYTAFLSVFLTGRRMVQVRSLRYGDLISKAGKSGYEYWLKVPRVKQKGGEFRISFRLISIVSDRYLVMKNLCLENLKFLENHIGKEIETKLQLMVPVFLQKERVLKLGSMEQFIRDLEKRPDYLQKTEAEMSQIIRDVSKKSRAISERTGEYVNFTSRRFRYTKGTNLSRRGIQGVLLAEALDHSDTQNVYVYVQNTPETADHIDAVMAPLLAPLAQAFAGKLIASERDALRAIDPHSRVKNGHANNVGSCGTNAFCISGYRACYTCVNFQPWRDAPHSEVRDEILAERAEQQQAGVSQFVIESTDRLLLAVEQVIMLCKQAKADERGQTLE